MRGRCGPSAARRGSQRHGEHQRDADGTTPALQRDCIHGTSSCTTGDHAVRTIYGNAPYPGLRLLTCGGTFDTASRQYLDNIVVYTHLVG